MVFPMVFLCFSVPFNNPGWNHKVNGQQFSSSGSDLTFTYSRPHTPIVKSISPTVTR